MISVRRATGILTLAVSLCAGQAFANPDPPSWNTFDEATFEQIFVTPSYASGTVNYTVSLGATPKITFGGNTYDVYMVGAFFAVGKDNSETFAASNGTGVTDWKWEYKEADKAGPIAGWVAEGNAQRIWKLGNASGFSNSKVFDYATFTMPNGGLDYGYHIGYIDQGTAVTAFFKGPTLVPEPSSMIGLFGSLIPIGACCIKRTRRS